MGLNVTRNQITAIAKMFNAGGESYLQRLDMIATCLGFKNQAALMAQLNAEQVDTKEMQLCDWRPDTHEGLGEPLDVKIEQTEKAINVFLGGADVAPDGADATTVRIEREGAVSRVMVYDGKCDAPRVLAVPRNQSMRELESDWEPVADNCDDEPGLSC